MKAEHHDKLRLGRVVDDGIRKLARDDVPETGLDTRERKRHTQRHRQCWVHRAGKLEAQAGRARRPGAAAGGNASSSIRDAARHESGMHGKTAACSGDWIRRTRGQTPCLAHLRCGQATPPHTPPALFHLARTRRYAGPPPNRSAPAPDRPHEAPAAAPLESGRATPPIDSAVRLGVWKVEAGSAWRRFPQQSSVVVTQPAGQDARGSGIRDMREPGFRRRGRQVHLVHLAQRLSDAHAATG